MIDSENPKNEYTIHEKTKQFSFKLIFGSPFDKTTLYYGDTKMKKIFFYGFKGYLKINSDQHSGLNSQLRLKRILEIFEKVKSCVIKNLLEAIDKYPKQIINYRHILINIVTDREYAQDLELVKLSKLIPVNLLGVGWKRLGELYNKNCYVEFEDLSGVSEKAKRAASMGYNIIIAYSKDELDLIHKITKAEDIGSLTASKLNKITCTITPLGNNKRFLESAGRILESLTSEKSHGYCEGNTQINETIELLDSNHSIDQDYHANSQITQWENTSELERSAIIKLQRKESYHYEGDFLKINEYKLALCDLDRDDINALTNPVDKEIFININSPVIKKMLQQSPEVQKVLLIEEITHELAHILGFGLTNHDIEFFQKHRILKYKAMLNL